MVCGSKDHEASRRCVALDRRRDDRGERIAPKRAGRQGVCTTEAALTTNLLEIGQWLTQKLSRFRCAYRRTRRWRSPSWQNASDMMILFAIRAATSATASGSKSM